MTLLRFPLLRSVQRAGAILLSLTLAITALAPAFVQPAAAGEADNDLLILSEGNGRFSIMADLSQDSDRGSAMFGDPGDQPLYGDWNCDGQATPGAYRTHSGRAFVTNKPGGGSTDASFYLGSPGDIAVAGDFNGDGCSTIAVYRPALAAFFIRNSLTSGPAERVRFFGNPGDQPFAGDFDGNGTDTFGVYRSNGRVYISNDLTSPTATVSFSFGNPGDRVVAGDWDGDGADSIAVYRASTGRVHLQNSASAVYVGTSAIALAAPADATTVAAPRAPVEAAPTPITWDIDIDLWPGDNIDAIAKRAPNGTVFRINGTHLGQSVEPKQGQVFVGAQGAVLDGKNKVEDAFSGDAKNVVIERLEITGYKSDLQKGAIYASGDGWIIRENNIHHNASGGIKYSHGDGGRIEGNNIHHNGQLGIGVGYSSGTIVERNEIAFNNWKAEVSWGWEAGGTKFWKTQGLIVRNNYSHDNHGPGLWDDKNNYNILYEGNLIEDNYANGIFHEIGYKAVIRNNTIRRNGFGHDSWLWGSGVLIASSQDTEVYGNVIEGNYNGITMTQQRRGSGDRGEYLAQNNSVHDNLIINSGITGAARDTDTNAIYNSNNTFRGNDYVGKNRWKWQEGQVSWSEWQNLGFDRTGSNKP